MMKSLNGFLVTLTLFFSVLTYSQSVTPTPELDYIIEDFILPGGRLGNNVNAIVQGPNGFMWFASHAGLHRYDGFEFVTYSIVPGDTIGETTSLSYQYLENLYWDRFGKLWVSTYGGGLYRFDPETEKFKHFKHNPDDSTSISHPRVLCATEDANGELWVGTENGLNRLDRKTETFKRYYADPTIAGALQAGDVRSLYVDKQGILWVGTGFVFFGGSEGALSRYNPDSDSFTNYTYDPKDKTSIWTSAVRGILEDSRGNFWVGTTMGLQKMDRNKGTFTRMTYNPGQPFAPGSEERQSPAVYSIYEDKRGGLWIGTIGDGNYATHLLRYDTASKTSQIFPIKSSAWQLCESEDGTIWIAGAGVSGKVLKIKPKARKFNLLAGGFLQEAYDASSLAGVLQYQKVVSMVGMVIDSANGDYWLQLMIADRLDSPTKGEAVLAHYKPRNGKLSFHHLRELKLDFDWTLQANQWSVNGLIIDKNGTLWGSYPTANIGIFNYDPGTGNTKQYLSHPDDSASLSSNYIITMMMDRRGEIWAATFENGLNRLNPETGKITHYHFDAQADAPVALMEDKHGKIWVGGEFLSNGISFITIIDPVAETMSNINLPDFGTLRVITTMAQSTVTGQVGFTIANGGIGFYDPTNKRFQFYDESTGFPFDNTATIVCDDKGTFWIAKEGRDAAFVSFANAKYFQFEEPVEWGTHLRKGFLGPDRSVYFYGLGEGWFQIDPELVKPLLNKESSKVQLVDLFVMGERLIPAPNGILENPLWQSNEIVLPSTVANFSLRFSDFNFQQASHQFLYRLYPYEVEWQKAGPIPLANYYKVPSGKYVFQVKSFSSSNLQDIPEVELKVIILPPWWRTYWAYGIHVLLFIGGILVVDRLQRKRLLAKANALAKEKELAQAKEIETAYHELKAAQQQLIQSEKMASLGELTAGIAHEIQNPLNFVNNFSEINDELISELVDELKTGNTEDALAIAADIKKNAQKINQHGKRAGSIVKGMLEHSRKSDGQKEPTDLNQLADECLRLAYHGMRAKDKNFQAEYATRFDKTIPKVPVVSQDISRVLLNLINNAFYAVHEKGKLAIPGYQPEVIIGSGKTDTGVSLYIKDNGNGIPDAIMDKIFQPFFTTKPTGSGTGLGLSLSYDIIKAHGGTIEVESQNGEYTCFTIYLPSP